MGKKWNKEWMKEGRKEEMKEGKKKEQGKKKTMKGNSVNNYKHFHHISLPENATSFNSFKRFPSYNIALCTYIILHNKD